MSGTEESNEHYKEFVPDSFIYGDYEPDVVERVINRQREIVKKAKGDEKNSIHNNVFMLLDDCMYDNKWTRHEIMRCVFMNGRHYRILFLLTLQYCMDLPPSLRGQIDYLFILRENIIQNRKKLYDHFFGIFPTFDSFNEVLNQCTENYECLRFFVSLRPQAYPDTKNKYIKEVLGYEHLEKEGGGEGGAEHCYGVFRLKDKIYKTEYSYYSHS
jgi:hypothetical protein